MVNRKYQLSMDMGAAIRFGCLFSAFGFLLMLKECKLVLVMYYIYTKIDQMNVYINIGWCCSLFHSSASQKMNNVMGRNLFTLNDINWKMHVLLKLKSGDNIIYIERTNGEINTGRIIIIGRMDRVNSEVLKTCKKKNQQLIRAKTFTNLPFRRSPLPSTTSSASVQHTNQGPFHVNVNVEEFTSIRWSNRFSKLFAGRNIF